MTRAIPRRIATSLLAGFFIALHPMAGWAQATKPAAGASAELRPIFATAPDILEGKRLADVSCTRCHGANGISTSAGVPHIAAQRPPYLRDNCAPICRGRARRAP